MGLFSYATNFLKYLYHVLNYVLNRSNLFPTSIPIRNVHTSCFNDALISSPVEETCNKRLSGGNTITLQCIRLNVQK